MTQYNAPTFSCPGIDSLHFVDFGRLKKGKQLAFADDLCREPDLRKGTVILVSTPCVLLLVFKHRQPLNTYVIPEAISFVQVIQ